VSRYNFDRSHEVIPGYKVGDGHWRSVAPKALTDRRERHGAQIVSEPGIYHGTVFKWSADARVQVQRSLQICLGCCGRSKNRDKQLTHIVRVMLRHLFFCPD